MYLENYQYNIYFKCRDYYLNQLNGYDYVGVNISSSLEIRYKLTIIE